MKNAAAVGGGHGRAAEDDLNRYQLLRQFITDEQAVAAIDALIREIGDRLAELEDGRSKAAASGP
jgi:hypothetical protein